MGNNRILNLKTLRGKPMPATGIYIGRPSKWGNPYTHLDFPSLIRVASRHEAIERYAGYIQNTPMLLASLPELVGKDLWCHCKPLACHGDILIRLMAEHGLIED